MPYIGNSPGTGTRNRFIYTATASQTTFSGADDNGKTLKYADSDYVDVYLNGICLVPVTDYTSTSKTSIVLTQAASLNDTLEVVAYDIATISDTVSKADGGTFEGDLGITSASPDLTFTNSTSEDTDGGRESTVTFKGKQSGGELSTLAEIEASHDGTADDEKGDLIFKTNDGSDGASPTERVRIDSAGSVMVGTSTEGHANADNFTISGSGSVGMTIRSTDSGDNNIYFSDGTSGDDELRGYVAYNHANNFMNFGIDATEAMRIKETAAHGAGLGIGTTAPLRQLHISNTSANSEIAFTAGTSGVSSILFGDGLTGTDVYRGYLQYNHSDDAMFLATSATERMRIDSNGNLLVGTTGSLVAGAKVRASSVAATFEGEVTHASGSGAVLWANRTSSDGWVAAWYRGGSSVGSISVTSSSTAYNTSSDYRLKENVTDVTDGITRVKQLAPKRFNFIADADTTVDGFLAHEAQTVVPEAITGTHNEVEVWEEGEELPDGVSVGDNKLDDDGNTIPKYQGIDQSKLVPLLTAALQEAIAKIETLETKVAALEAG